MGAGKPGGLVVEGEEADVAEFMRLMRTEFFQHVSTHSKKLTTRLQERWPLDAENERFEAAEVMETSPRNSRSESASGWRSRCTTKGVYFKCGCEEPPTLEEVNAKRCFQDFTILPNVEEGHALPPDLRTFSKICKDRGLMGGFHETFDYRFS